MHLSPLVPLAKREEKRGREPPKFTSRLLKADTIRQNWTWFFTVSWMIIMIINDVFHWLPSLWQALCFISFTTFPSRENYEILRCGEIGAQRGEASWAKLTKLASGRARTQAWPNHNYTDSTRIGCEVLKIVLGSLEFITYTWLDLMAVPNPELTLSSPWARNTIASQWGQWFC